MIPIRISWVRFPQHKFFGKLILKVQQLLTRHKKMLLERLFFNSGVWWGLTTAGFDVKRVTHGMGKVLNNNNQINCSPFQVQQIIFNSRSIWGRVAPSRRGRVIQPFKRFFSRVQKEQQRRNFSRHFFKRLSWASGSRGSRATSGGPSSGRRGSGGGSGGGRTSSAGTKARKKL